MRLHLFAALAALGAIAPAAAGAGFPVPGMDTTQQGATAPGDPYRYVAIPAKDARSTIVMKLRREGGVALRHRELPGASVVAPVAMDASTTGLSADGATLVLIDPRGPEVARVTHLVVVDTRTLRPTRRLRLVGDFTLDGISPDGRRLYVVQYRGGSPFDYAVRAYDVARGRLLPRPIVDPRHPDEKMSGMPMTRTMSADGRWAYTLYGGGDEEFVHALDTARGRAFCIDLTGLAADDLSAMKLVSRGGHVDLVNPSGATVRRIDASTFRVSEPRAAAPRAAAKPAGDPPGNGFPWPLAAAVAAVAGAALFVLRRRYAAGTDSAASRSASSSSSTVP